MTMHIEILKDVVKGVAGFRVRVVDADGHIVRTFTYPTIESARRQRGHGPSLTATVQ
jgi:hypothetical protein